MIGAIVLIIAGVALVVALIVMMVLAEKKRRKRLAEWATKTGMVVYDPTSELAWLKGFQAYGPGYGHRAFDGYQGSRDGVPVKVFQHQSRTRTKDSEAIHNFTVCVAKAPLSAPDLVIKREHWGHKIADALGAEDIDFESAEFSKKFWVKCKDRRFAYDVLHPRMMDWFLRSPKIHWQWNGRRLVLSVSGSLKPETAEPLLKAATTFLANLPRHLERS